MYNPDDYEIYSFEEGKAICTGDGDVVMLAATDRDNLTRKFMDLVSQEGGGWRLYVEGVNILDVCLHHGVRDMSFETRLNNLVARLTATGLPLERARLRALSMLSLPICSISDLIETYYGKAPDSDFVWDCWHEDFHLCYAHGD